MKILAYENIYVRLGGKQILKGASLDVSEGTVTGIIGPNGCGKSTLIKTTFGICQRSAGAIIVKGKNSREYTPRQLAAEIGYVGQDAACAFDFTVREIAAMGMYSRKDKSAPAAAVVESVLNELGISNLADRGIQSLSGGERKMAFIARATVQGADVLILDEPTNHLDIKHQLFLLDYLKESGKTVLIVLHDLRLAAHYCDFVYLMHDGAVYVCGKPIEALSEENVRTVFGINGRAYVTASGQTDFSLFGNEIL